MTPQGAAEELIRAADLVRMLQQAGRPIETADGRRLTYAAQVWTAARTGAPQPSHVTPVGRRPTHDRVPPWRT